jgi:hypothetical protein
MMKARKSVMTRAVAREEVMLNLKDGPIRENNIAMDIGK